MTASYLPGHYFPGKKRSIKILDYAANETNEVRLSTYTLSRTHRKTETEIITLNSCIKAKTIYFDYRGETPYSVSGIRC